MTVFCWECGKEIQGEKHHFKLPSNNWMISDGNDLNNLFGRNNDEREELPADNVESKRTYCTGCIEKVRIEYKQDFDDFIRLKSKLMVERAIRMLEKQDVEIYYYQEEITTIKEYAAEKPYKFMSAHEVLSAIILLSNEIEMKIQHKIGKHRVDFFLPSLKTVLEIDGYMHKYSKKKDVRRDEEIRQELGAGYDIVRIPTKYIESKVELLVEAIRTVRTERRRVG